MLHLYRARGLFKNCQPWTYDSRGLGLNQMFWAAPRFGLDRGFWAGLGPTPTQPLIAEGLHVPTIKKKRLNTFLTSKNVWHKRKTFRINEKQESHTHSLFMFFISNLTLSEETHANVAFLLVTGKLKSRLISQISPNRFSYSRFWPSKFFFVNNQLLHLQLLSGYQSSLAELNLSFLFWISLIRVWFGLSSSLGYNNGGYGFCYKWHSRRKYLWSWWW